MRVGDHLDLDVAPTTDQALQEHHWIPEGGLGLGPRALEGLRQLVRRPHHADAAPATATSGLDHHRVPDGVRMTRCVLGTGDGPPAPCGHRHPGLLRQELGLDLVAQLPHGSCGGADEDQTEALAELGERRVLCYEPPPDPHRVSVTDLQCSLQLRVVQVRDARRADVPQADCLVCCSNEQRPLLCPGVQSDDLDVPATLIVELPHRPGDPHRRLTPVDHRESLEHVRLR